MLYWEDHYGRFWPVCECLQKWLPAYEAELLQRGLIHTCIDIFQTIGNAQASAGTHSQGGCADLGQTSTEQLRVARNMGAADWRRDADPDDGQPDFRPTHAHLSLKGCPHAVQYARDQVDDLEDGFNGLGVLEDHAGARDDGPRSGVLWPLRTWQQGIAWAATTAATRYPADVFGKGWKYTSPFDGPDSGSWADEVRQPKLATYTSSALVVDSAGAVVFTCHHGDATTSGTKNSRSEIREMTPDGLDEIEWDGRDGEHRMAVEMAITHLTNVKPHIVLAQIHNGDDDVTTLRGEGVKGTDRVKMYLTRGDVTHAKYLGEVKLGQRFKFAFDVKDGRIRFDWNGVRVTHIVDGTVRQWTVAATADCFFKCGNYLQSNPETAPNESRSAWSQARLYGRPEVRHAA